MAIITIAKASKQERKQIVYLTEMPMFGLNELKMEKIYSEINTLEKSNIWATGSALADRSNIFVRRYETKENGEAKFTVVKW